MRPFDEYPGEGRRLLGALPQAANANPLVPALEMQFITGQLRCAYCDGSLFGQYSCSLPRIDRVVPAADAERLGFPHDYALDITNTVLCCSSCHELAQRYAVPGEMRAFGTSESAFLALRDRLFAERRAMMESGAAAEPEAEPVDVWDLPKAA